MILFAARPGFSPSGRVRHIEHIFPFLQTKKAAAPPLPPMRDLAQPTA